MTSLQRSIARWSLAILWLATALISAFISPEVGFSILAHGGIERESAEVMLYGGSLLDALLGIWLVTGWQLRLCCQLQLLTIGIYTVLLTILAPEFWLHPFAPVLKNLPVLVLIWFIMPATDSDN